MEITYRLACKVSGLAYLRDRGFIDMSLWNFPRWRSARRPRSANSSDRAVAALFERLCTKSAQPIGSYHMLTPC